MNSMPPTFNFLVDVDYFILFRRSAEITWPEVEVSPTFSIAGVWRSISWYVLVDAIACSSLGQGTVLCLDTVRVSTIYSTLPGVGAVGREKGSKVSCDTCFQLCLYAPTPKRYDRYKIYMGERNRVNAKKKWNEKGSPGYDRVVYEKKISRKMPRSEMSWKKLEKSGLGPYGIDSPSRSEELRFIDSAKSLSTVDGRWGFGWVDKAQCLLGESAPYISSPDFSRVFQNIWLLGIKCQESL